MRHLDRPQDDEPLWPTIRAEMERAATYRAAAMERLRKMEQLTEEDVRRIAREETLKALREYDVLVGVGVPEDDDDAPPGNAPNGDYLLARLQTIENLLGITGPGAGGLSFPSARLGGSGPQVFPAVSSFYIDALQTSSINPVTLASSPSVTATIGQSGDAYVELATQVTGEATGDQGFVYCYVDGTT